MHTTYNHESELLTQTVCFILPDKGLWLNILLLGIR